MGRGEQLAVDFFHFFLIGGSRHLIVAFSFRLCCGHCIYMGGVGSLLTGVCFTSAYGGFFLAFGMKHKSSRCIDIGSEQYD